MLRVKLYVYLGVMILIKLQIDIYQLRWYRNNLFIYSNVEIGIQGTLRLFWSYDRVGSSPASSTTPYSRFNPYMIYKNRSTQTTTADKLHLN